MRSYAIIITTTPLYYGHVYYSNDDTELLSMSLDNL